MSERLADNPGMKWRRHQVEPEPPQPDLPEWLRPEILDGSAAYVYAFDTEMRYLYLNRLALIMGYGGRPLSHVLGKRGRDFFPAGNDATSDLDELERNNQRVMRTGLPVQLYEVLQGRVLYSQKWPLRHDGKIVGVAGFSFDVTNVVSERVRGDGDDVELIVNMVASTSRMMQAMARMNAQIA